MTLSMTNTMTDTMTNTNTPRSSQNLEDDSIARSSGGFQSMTKHQTKSQASGSAAARPCAARQSPARRSPSVPAVALAMTLAGALVLGMPAPAQAGRGSSPQAIARAISSGSPDAIKSELERAEYLVCAACVDYVLPLVDSDDEGVRRVAAWWLARRGTSRQVFRDMLTRLGQPDSTHARNAADVLGAFSDPTAVPALAAALSNPLYDPAARAAMAHALGEIRRPVAAESLRSALRDREAPVRAAALSAIRMLEGFRDGAVAVPLLGDPDEAVRVQAIYTVAELRTAGAASALVTVLQTDSSASARKRAAWALGEIHAPAAVASQPLSQAAASDPSPMVRSLASAAMANLGR